MKQADGAKTEAKMEAGGAPAVSIRHFLRFATALDILLIVAGTLGSLALGAAQPAQMIFFGQVIDTIGASALGGNAVDVEARLQETLRLYMYLAVGAFVAGFVATYCWKLTGERQAAQYRQHFLKAILRQDVAWHDARATAGLAAMFAESTQLVEEGLGVRLAEGLRFLGTGIAGVAVALSFQWNVALVLLALSPLAIAAASTLNRVNALTAKRTQAAFAIAGAAAAEVLGAIRTVASFGGEEREAARFDKELDPAEVAGIKASVRKGLANGMLGATSTLVIAAGIVYGASIIANERESTGCLATETCKISGGAVLLTIFAMNRGAQSLGFISQTMASFANARTAAGQMDATMLRTPAIDCFSEEGLTPDAAALVGKLEFKSVSFRYPLRPDAVIYSKFDLVIEPGMTCALVGSSGSGKSTAIALIERFYDPDSGSVLLDGMDITTLQLKWLRQQIGLVGQEPVLFDGTIAENIAYGRPDATRADVEEAARSANAHGFISLFPDGFETRVAQGQLSGGQKQRVAIARAILKNPTILLLDEATSALDNESERVVQAALDALLAAQKRTTIVVAHRLSTIRNADKIAFVGEGRVIEQGTHEQLLRLKGHYSRLLSQATGGGSKRAALVAVPDFGFGSAQLQPIVLKSKSESIPEIKIDIPASHTHTKANSAGSVAATGTGSAWLPLPWGSRKDGKVTVRDAELGTVSLTNAAPATEPEGLKDGSTAAFKKQLKKEAAIEKADAKARSKAKKAIAKAERARVWDLQRPERSHLRLAVVSALFLGGLSPAIGVMLTKLIVVFFIPDPDRMRREAWTWAAILFGISVAQVLLEVARSWGLGVAGERLTKRLRAVAYASMLRQEQGWHDAALNSASNLTANLSRDVTLVTAVTGEASGIQLANIATVVVGLCLIFTLGTWQLGLVALGVIPVIGATLALQMASQRGEGANSKASKKVDVAGAPDASEGQSAAEQRKAAQAAVKLAKDRENNGAAAREGASRIVGQLSSSVRTVASFGLEPSLYAAYEREINAAASAQIRRAYIPALTTGFSQFATTAAMVALYAYGANLVSTGQATFESMFIVILVMFLMAQGLGQFAQGATDQSLASRAVSRILMVTERKSHLDPTSEAGKLVRASEVRGWVEFKNVSFAYPSRPDAQIYSNFSLSIEAGKTVALVGGSGSGKSTAVQLLLRFYDPDSGSVLLDGLDIITLQLKWLRQQIGLVGQEPTLFDGTVAHNIAYGKPDATGEEVEEAARMANAHAFISLFPDGFDTRVGQSGTQLSGGQKQRIAIARALLKNPTILLLDEATSALDNESERVVQAALDAVMAAQKRTTIVIAHRLSTIRNADKIAFVGEGRVLEEGTHRQLLGRNGKYAVLISATDPTRAT